MLHGNLCEVREVCMLDVMSVRSVSSACSTVMSVRSAGRKCNGRVSCVHAVAADSSRLSLDGGNCSAAAVAAQGDESEYFSHH